MGLLRQVASICAACRERKRVLVVILFHSVILTKHYSINATHACKATPNAPCEEWWRRNDGMLRAPGVKA